MKAREVPAKAMARNRAVAPRTDCAVGDEARNVSRWSPPGTTRRALGILAASNIAVDRARFPYSSWEPTATSKAPDVGLVAQGPGTSGGIWPAMLAQRVPSSLE